VSALSKLVHEGPWTVSAGAWSKGVDEGHSAQTCSRCEARTGPTGQKSISIRNSTCSVRQTSHERDVKAATNVLRGAWRNDAGSISLQLLKRNRRSQTTPEPDGARLRKKSQFFRGRGPQNKKRPDRHCDWPDFQGNELHKRLRL